MEEFSTKRGSVTFGTEKIMMEESVKAYLKNSFNGFWEEGGLNKKIFFLSMAGLMSFSITFLTVSFYYAPVRAQLNVAVMVMALALSLVIYEHWNKVDREKFVLYDDIDYVEYVEGLNPLTCPRFILNYSKDNEKKTRYIVMPTKYMPGVKEDVEGIKKEFEDRDIRLV